MNVWQDLGRIVRDILKLRDTTDVRGTIESIRNGTNLRGYNVWILACGAIIASIGLDLDSPAVIIGAMLISPLMSPILGIGLSIGINDRQHLLNALENFSVAVVASLVMATLYFLITPIGLRNESIMSRTEPTVLDVMVAFAGGVAGIVAGSRKDKTNAIPGVAIATALMPPICVAGFGLANQDWSVLLGALYLFFINSVFIAFATYLIVRLLRFPYTEYQDEESRKKAFRWVLVFVIVISLPSAYFFREVIQRYQMNSQAQRFIEEYINNDYHRALDYDLQDQDSLYRLNVYMTGMILGPDSVAYLQQQLQGFDLPRINLHLVQNLPGTDENELLTKTRIELLRELQPQLARQQAQMDSIRQHLWQRELDSLRVVQVAEEMYHLHPELASVAYAGQTISYRPKQPADTITTIILAWNNGLTRSQRRQKEAQLQAWLPQRLGVDTCALIVR